MEKDLIRLSIYNCDKCSEASEYTIHVNFGFTLHAVTKLSEMCFAKLMGSYCKYSLVLY